MNQRTTNTFLIAIVLLLLGAAIALGEWISALERELATVQARVATLEGAVKK